MAKYKLTQEIISRSEAENWNEAVLEWSLKHIYMSKEPQTCLCGHYPIIETCVIRNRENFCEVEVGNCCVKKFIGLDSEQLFASVRRVKANPDCASLNREAISWAHENCFINDWEKSFYLDTWRKRKLSSRQADKRAVINRKVLAAVMK